MQSPDSQIVVKRFFQALEKLKDDYKIRGLQTFTNRYDLNKRNMYAQKNDPSRDIVQLSWFTYLVRDYNVSATWLLTGEGSFYAHVEPKPCKNPAAKNNIINNGI